MYVSSYIFECESLNHAYLNNYGDKNLTLFLNSRRVSGVILESMSRISQFALSIFASIHALATHTIRACDELVVTIIDFDFTGESADRTFVHLVAAIMQPLAILTLGLTRIIPANELHDALKKCYLNWDENLFDKDFHNTLDDQRANNSITAFPDTFFFPPMKGRIQAPIRGFLIGINEAIRTVFHAAHWTIVATSNDKTLKDIVADRFQRSASNILSAPFCGLAGIFDDDILDELNIIQR